MRRAATLFLWSLLVVILMVGAVWVVLTIAYWLTHRDHWDE